jgi:GAF domain-containing protein
MKIYQSLHPLFTSRGTGYSESLQIWRERIFSAITTLGSSAGLIVYIIMVYNQVQRKSFMLLWLYTAAYAWLIIITLVRTLPYHFRAANLIAMLYSVGILASLETGSVGDGRVWFLAVPIITTIFIGGRAGLVATFWSFLSWLGIGFLFAQNVIPYQYQTVENMIQFDNLNTYFSTGITLLVIGLTIVASSSAILNNLNITLRQSRNLTDELEQKSTQLQQQTQRLEDRTDILEFTAQISRSLAAILEPDRIINQAARQISDKFDLEHLFVFYWNEVNSTLSLQASDKDLGDGHLALGQSFLLGEDLFKNVIDTAQPLLILDGEEESLPMPASIPTTPSYAVFPMRARETVLGIISMHSQKPAIFEPDELIALQILVDHIAILFANAQLFTEREAAIEAERKAYGQFTQDAWQDFIQSRRHFGYRRDRSGFSAIDPENLTDEQLNPEIRSIPIRLRGKVIGYVDAKKVTGAGTWQPTETGLLETLSDRLESALDTARLYEETQQLAEHERIIRQATTHMRETLDIRTILKTATQEIAQSLGLDALEIQLGEVEQLLNGKNE